MFRTAAALLSVAFLATAANAAEVKVSTLDKSPTQVRAAVGDAAFKACKQAYAEDVFAIYERESCVRDSVADALAQTNSAVAANAAHKGAPVLASR